MTATEPEIAGNGEPQNEQPFALALDDFVALQLEPPIPILGTETHPIIPAGGLVLLAGREGVGKTTFAIDLAFHLASGVDWLGFPIPEPVNVLLLENEGPQLMFREKLRLKRDRWPHTRQATIHVQTMRWGHFSFADPHAKQQLVGYSDEHEIDVILGDPLGTLGMKGVGSPEDVRDFVRELAQCGLYSNRAFLFLHHFRKEGGDDEIRELQGAWGGPLDTLLTLKLGQRSNELRLNVPKSRWFRETLKAMVVGKVNNTMAFELLGEEGDPRMLEEEIAELLGDGVWRTRDEIAIEGKTPPKQWDAAGGIGASKEQVARCLKGNSHLFTSAPGGDHGRSSKATIWQLTENAQEGSRADGDAGQARLPGTAGEPAAVVEASGGEWLDGRGELGGSETEAAAQGSGSRDDFPW